MQIRSIIFLLQKVYVSFISLKKGILGLHCSFSTRMDYIMQIFLRDGTTTRHPHRVFIGCVIDNEWPRLDRGFLTARGDR